MPFLKKPTVNIGNRQKGRLMSDSVIGCPDSSNAIIQAIEEALSPAFQEKLPHFIPLYGAGNVSLRIKDVLKTWNLEGILMKKFFDL